MKKNHDINLSESQYINYLAVDIAEKLMSLPKQSDIDKIEKSIKRYASVLKANIFYQCNQYS